VHDHGFNNISTYGNLLRLMREGKIPSTTGEGFLRTGLESLRRGTGGALDATGRRLWNLSLVQWPALAVRGTIRSLRVLAVAHQLGHVLMSEGDRRISLLDAWSSTRPRPRANNIYYGEGRDAYDVLRRVRMRAFSM